MSVYEFFLSVMPDLIRHPDVKTLDSGFRRNDTFSETVDYGHTLTIEGTEDIQWIVIKVFWFVVRSLKGN
jgi:hypothetical protein